MLQDDVVHAAVNGDAGAFETLFRDIQPRLLRYLPSLVGQDAPDVAAETWTKVVADLGRFHGGYAQFRAWVVTIARRRALDTLRANGRRRADVYDPASLPEPTPAPDASELSEQAAGTQEALRVIRLLSPDQAEAVLLQVVIGLDAPAAARVLGKRAGAVRMATSRGLARLEQLLADEQPTGRVSAPSGTRSDTFGTPDALRVT